MKKSIIFTYITLILLTVATALIASSSMLSKLAVFLIMGISAIKFLLVAFQFMEMKIANPFWKYTLSIVLVLIVSSILLLRF